MDSCRFLRNLVHMFWVHGASFLCFGFRVASAYVSWSRLTECKKAFRDSVQLRYKASSVAIILKP